MKTISKCKGRFIVKVFYEEAVFTTDQYGEHAIVPYEYYIDDELIFRTKCHMSLDDYLAETK